MPEGDQDVETVVGLYLLGQVLSKMIRFTNKLNFSIHIETTSLISRTSIDEWKTTPWKDIDVENMDMECKKFSKV